MTICGRNFGFDKTENFKASLVTVEVGGAPCKLLRQDNLNRCVGLRDRGAFRFQVLHVSRRGEAETEGIKWRLFMRERDPYTTWYRAEQV